MCSKAVECPNSNLILIKYSFKGFTSYNDVSYGRSRTVETHASQKSHKAWLNLKQKYLEASLPSVYMYRPRMANH